MLYRITGHIEECKNILEKLFKLKPSIKNSDNVLIYQEAEKLYQEAKNISQ